MPLSPTVVFWPCACFVLNLTQSLSSFSDYVESPGHILLSPASAQGLPTLLMGEDLSRLEQALEPSFPLQYSVPLDGPY